MIDIDFFKSVNDRYGHEVEDLLKHADMALYDAKRGGRDRICLYNAGNRSPSRGELSISLESEGGLRANQVVSSIDWFTPPPLTACSAISA